MKLKRLGSMALALTLTLSLWVAPAHAAAFTDMVNADGTPHWATEYVNRMSNLGYAKGYENTDENGKSLGTYAFNPDRKMTAAEALLFCARTTGLDSVTQGKIAQARAEEVEDILPESMVSWAAKEMAIALETGVLSQAELAALAEEDVSSRKVDSSGKVTSRSYLEGTITRENICMYLVRAMQLEPLAKSLTNYSMTYKDTDEISLSLQPYVYVLSNFGIVQGNTDGNFSPKGSLTRAEMTTMLCRALDFMEKAGITVELSEYTTYAWEAGVISAVTSAADGSIILTLTSDIMGTRSFSVPTGAKIFEDNMLTSGTALKSGQYARLNLNNRGAVTEVRMSGALTSYSGVVSSLADDQLSIQVAGTTRKFSIDRFTQVKAGSAVGDRSIIDEEADYSSATCYVDGMGHLAGVIFAGGTQLVEGLLERVTTSGGSTYLGVTGFDGVVHQYKIPTGIAITVNGMIGSLSSNQSGKYVQLRVSNDTGEAVSVAVDTVTQYIQGPITQKGTQGTAIRFYIKDVFANKEVQYNISTSAPVTYNGEVKKITEIERGWYVTVLIANGMIVQMDAFPGSVTVEGTLKNIAFDSQSSTTNLTANLEVVQKDDTSTTFTVDMADPPAITRNGKTASFTELRTSDSVVITIRYNNVEKIDATAQSANLSGTVVGINQNISSGNEITVRLSDGTTVSYPIPVGISITQDGKSVDVKTIQPGNTVGLVTNGDQLVSITITGSASVHNEVKGTVVMTTSTGGKKTITLLVENGTENPSPVDVDVKGAKLMDITNAELSLTSGFPFGSTVHAFGNYSGGVFVATIVIKQ